MYPADKHLRVDHLLAKILEQVIVNLEAGAPLAHLRARAIQAKIQRGAFMSSQLGLALVTTS